MIQTHSPNSKCRKQVKRCLCLCTLYCKLTLWNGMKVVNYRDPEILLLNSPTKKVAVSNKQYREQQERTSFKKKNPFIPQKIPTRENDSSFSCFSFFFKSANIDHRCTKHLKVNKSKQISSRNPLSA